MTILRKICPKTRALAYCMVVHEKKSLQETAKILKIAVSSVHRCCKEGIAMKKNSRNFKETRGRKKLISQRQQAKFLRTFRKLHEGGKNPTVADFMREAGAFKGSYRTHVRILNEAGYKKLVPRKKGLLSNKDRRFRKKFAREALKLYDDEFWSNDVAFYLDGVSFVHKFKPFYRSIKTKWACVAQAKRRASVQDDWF